MNGRMRDMVSRKRMRDGRNPYGARGGYVSSRRIDRRMGMGNDYSERDMRYDYRDSRQRYGYDSMPMEQHREYSRPVEFYGYGAMKRPDYDYGYDMKSGNEEQEYYDDLKEWCLQLKKHDKFGLPKEEIINQARQMGVRFDNFDEEEFVTTYYMLMSDFPDAFPQFQSYLDMANKWLNDEDSNLKGSEKLCAYMYEVVKAE